MTRLREEDPLRYPEEVLVWSLDQEVDPPTDLGDLSVQEVELMVSMA